MNLTVKEKKKTFKHENSRISLFYTKILLTCDAKC